MNDNKNIKLTFYIVCGLLLGAPYIVRLIKLIPEILETLPNAKEILSASGYTILVIASVVVAYKLKEYLWIRIIGIYASVGLAISILTLTTEALGAGDLFLGLFGLVCAPFYGIQSPLAVTVLMLVLTITSYAFLNKLPKSNNDSGKTE